MLKISTRTIDRYIRRGHLSARQINGRIWLAKDEILNMKNGVSTLPSREHLQHESMDNDTLPYRQQSVDQDGGSDRNRDFYRDLYTQAIKVLEERNQKLESANYRIGQLEAQVGNAKTYRSEESDEDTVTKRRLQAILMENGKIIARLEKRLANEKLNRAVFAWLLYGVLILQPILWFVLRNR